MNGSLVHRATFERITSLPGDYHLQSINLHALQAARGRQPDSGVAGPRGVRFVILRHGGDQVGTAGGGTFAHARALFGESVAIYLAAAAGCGASFPTGEGQPARVLLGLARLDPAA
jgi:hypothetical protein